MQNPEVLQTILLAVIAGASTIPAYYTWSDRRLKVEVTRFIEYSELLGASVRMRKIKIANPNQVIKRCNILLDNVNLRWPDGSVEKYLMAGHTENASIPEEIHPNDNSEVVLRDGSRTRKRRKWKDIPEVKG